MDNREKALVALKQKLGNSVHTKENELYAVSYDGLKVSGSPQALIKVQQAADVGEVLRLANEFSVPVTSRGTGSSLTGGATPYQGGWVLDLSQLSSLEIDPTNMLARCGPWRGGGRFAGKSIRKRAFLSPRSIIKKILHIGRECCLQRGWFALCKIWRHSRLCIVVGWLFTNWGICEMGEGNS
jgi:hypothetical protein